MFAQKKETEPRNGPPQAPERVKVKPTNRDEEIQQRLSEILSATDWFINPQVEVNKGVVFLSGKTQTDEYKKWAGNLARNMQDVAAVVNKIEVIGVPFWDFSPILNALQSQWRGAIGSLPSILTGLIILVVAFLVAKLGAAITRKTLKKRMIQPLLRDVIARAIGIIIFLFGIYVIFEMADLTNAAFTIIGGTGLLGIILGIAFRDITENFLASILLSIQHPFKNGDLIEIERTTGYVQSLTMRVTVLMSLDGNHIQIPNSVVYKSKIRNFTSNPNRREEFTVGIGFDAVISEAQEVALKVLNGHEAVLKDPEPWVLVDTIGKATIVLRIYFWLDGSEHSWLKVKSSVIRLIKRAFQAKGISMPDEARERIFPQGLPVQIVEKAKEKVLAHHKESGSTATEAESELSSEAQDIKEQAEQARLPEEGKNLLNKRGS